MSNEHAEYIKALVKSAGRMYKDIKDSTMRSNLKIALTSNKIDIKFL